MNLADKQGVALFSMLSACLLFGVSTVAMFLRFEPFYSIYYSFAWWCYIVFVESLLCRRGGKSLLFDSPGEFLLLLPLSVTVWLVFEALNFRLLDWRYINIPSNVLIRWIGYPVAYSTVLPGIFSTKNLLESLGCLKNSRAHFLAGARRLYRPFIFSGILFLVLPFLWPCCFFPLVWLAFALLLEPLNHKAGAPSLLREWEKGSLREFYLLLLSGALCGFLWEFWNFRAGSKWIYTVPHLGFLKVFEMPLLGFLGFPPFALECYAMTASFFLLISKIGEKYPRNRALAIYWSAAASMALFDLLVLAGIDRFTVISYADFVPFGRLR
jgi:hypothetical protein